MSALLTETMRREFPAAVQSTTRAGLPRFTIPALVKEFGPLVAEVDPNVELTLVIGHFMHTHFDGDSAVDRLVARCCEILADKIVITSFPDGASMSPRECVDFTEEGVFWIWSGRLPQRSAE